MTPEERAQSVLHFLDEYLDAREGFVMKDARWYDKDRISSARQFLGTALVALVTEATSTVEQPGKHWHSGDPIMPGGSTDMRRKRTE